MPYLLSCNGAVALLAGRTSDSMRLDARHSRRLPGCPQCWQGSSIECQQGPCGFMLKHMKDQSSCRLGSQGCSC